MTPTEAAQLLTVAATRDRRIIGRTDILAWHEDLDDIDYDEAVIALRRHFRGSTEYLMAAHIRALVIEIRQERGRTRRHEVRDQPWAHEPGFDHEGLSAGMARCRAVLASTPRVGRSEAPQGSAFDELCAITPGVRWVEHPDIEVA